VPPCSAAPPHPAEASPLAKLSAAAPWPRSIVRFDQVQGTLPSDLTVLKNMFRMWVGVQ
jgi:hypothetical protein